MKWSYSYSKLFVHSLMHLKHLDRSSQANEKKTSDQGLQASFFSSGLISLSPSIWMLKCRLHFIYVLLFVRHSLIILDQIATSTIGLCRCSTLLHLFFVNFFWLLFWYISRYREKVSISLQQVFPSISINPFTLVHLWRIGIYSPITGTWYNSYRKQVCYMVWSWLDRLAIYNYLCYKFLRWPPCVLASQFEDYF